MPIIGTKPVEKAGVGIVTKEAVAKRKSLTQQDRFNAYIADVVGRLKEEGNSKAEVSELLQTILTKHIKVKKAEGAGRGLFYQIFGASPKVGDKVTPSEVLERTEGKGALTETILKRWADPTKGVPYGNKATAEITFHRRDRLTGAEAYYSLDAYSPASISVEGTDANGLA
jgi:hypothetical protein